MRKLNLVFMRYLLILLIFSALLLVLFVPAYLYIYNFTLTSELNHVYDRLNWGVSSLDDSISAINYIAILTGRDSRFRIFRQERHVIEANLVILNELRDHFNSLLFSYPVVANAGLVFNRNLILTRQHIFYLPERVNFYGFHLQSEGLTEEEWFSLISKTNTLSPVMQFSSIDYGPYEGLIYTVQLGGGPGILFATLPVNRIISLLAEDDKLSQSSIRIFDNNDNTLYQYSGESWNPHNRFHTLTGRSEIRPVFFEMMVSEQLISSQMKPVVRLMIAFATITFFMVICLSLFFAYKWSEPMRSFLLSIDSTKILKGEYEQNIGQADFRFKNGYFASQTQ